MMIGHAVFDDPRLHTTSQFMTQYPADERIIAVDVKPGVRAAVQVDMRAP